MNIRDEIARINKDAQQDSVPMDIWMRRCADAFQKFADHLETRFAEKEKEVGAKKSSKKVDRTSDQASNISS